MSAVTNHLAPETLSRFVDRALSPDAAADCARHVATCDACAAALEQWQDAGRLLRQSTPAPEWEGTCPPVDVWDGFVADGSREELEGHLAACPECRAVLAAQRLRPDVHAAELTSGAPQSDTSTLICFRCRAPLSDSDRFCPACGAQITARTGTAALIRRGPGAWFTHLWLAASLTALGLSFFWPARFYQCLVVALGAFLFWLHLRNPVRQYLDILTALQRGDSARADAILENLKRRLGGRQG